MIRIITDVSGGNDFGPNEEREVKFTTIWWSIHQKFITTKI